MECACIRHTELPHTTRLFADFVYHFNGVRAFYPHSALDPAAYSAAAAEVRFPDGRRAALVEALRALNPDSESLRRLGQQGTLAVVTGQQVGLYSGPAYTIYKALTAAKLARHLTARGIPAVPVFWLATEDHDFAEISRCWVFDPSHKPIALDAPAPADGGGPVGALPVDRLPLEDLRRALEGFPHGEQIAAMVEQTYAPGAKFGPAFSALLKRLLAPYDLLHVDPMHPAVRDLAAGTIRAALERAPELTERLLGRNQQLIDAGYHAQVHVEDHTSLVFLLENGKRTALKRKGREYAAGARRFTTEQLAAQAAHLSPNALLRPVVQDSLLPTVAYVGGPAELAYLAQAEVLYRDLLGRMPVAVSRSAFTLFDQRSDKLMRRYRLTLADFFHGEEAVRERIAQVLVPPPLAGSMEAAKSAAAGALDQLSGNLDHFDPTLAAALATSRRKIEHQLSKIEHKIRREAVRRDERASRDAAYLAGLLYPERHLQERIYSIIPFLARHGLDLVDHIHENIQLDCPDHRLLMV